MRDNKNKKNGSPRLVCGRVGDRDSTGSCSCCCHSQTILYDCHLPHPKQDQRRRVGQPMLFSVGIDGFNVEASVFGFIES